MKHAKELHISLTEGEEKAGTRIFRVEDSADPDDIALVDMWPGDHGAILFCQRCHLRAFSDDRCEHIDEVVPYV